MPQPEGLHATTKTHAAKKKLIKKKKDSKAQKSGASFFLKIKLKK